MFFFSSNKTKAFTLLEVLIAMVIFGTTVTFLLRNINDQQRVHLDVEIKTFAHWVAVNKMAETKIEKKWPNIGVTRGDVEMHNHKWFWLQTVSKTTDKKYSDNSNTRLPNHNPTNTPTDRYSDNLTTKSHHTDPRYPK